MVKKNPDQAIAAAPSNGPGQKPYRQPKLSVYGNLQRLTMGGTNNKKEGLSSGPPPNTHS